MITSLECAHCHQPAVQGDRFCGSCGKQLKTGSTLIETQAVTDPQSRVARADAELLQTLRDATLGEYDIYGELGRGGMAIVYLAHDIALDRKVAIKVLMPALLHSEGMAERFTNEARSAARLSHRNIIPIYAVKETERIVYFVMKFVPGKPLDQLISDLDVPMPIPMAQSILLQVGRALGHLHNEGVFHRDVKPANIVIDTDGSAVVMDFGIAKRTDVTGMTVTGTTLGTPYYMSPEQCKSEPLTPAADQYSLGIVAYEMLTGAVPFSGASAMETMSKNCYDEPPPLIERRPDCPKAMVAAVHRMLEKDASDRFPSMEDAISAMEAKPLSADDPVQKGLVRLVREGQDDFLARVQTPRSPVPATRSPSSAHRTGPRTPDPQHYSGASLGQFESLQGGQTPNGTRWALGAVGVLALAAGLWFWQSLSPAVGQVIIEGLPAGAVVVVDGTPRPGNTFELAPGSHDFQVLAEGFDAMTETLQVAAGGIIRTPFTGQRIALTTGTVVVEGLPSGGIVFADGNRQSDTTFDLSSGATHEIQMSAVGFTTVVRTIDLAPGEVRTLQYTGGPAVVQGPTAGVDTTVVATQVVDTGPGLLQMQIVPAAYVWLDGDSLGDMNRRQLSMSSGIRHVLRFQRESYMTIDTTVILQPGETRQWNIRLDPRRP